jgi:HD-GYP domain-containing protein (c-di-GMP phosphodiesterase class II)
VARRAKLPADAVALVYWGAMVHDIGELNVRRTVLDKAAPLDDQERAQICEHTTVGARWLAAVPGLSALVPFARWHHERFDGKGYPDGCTAERLPLTVSIVAVCDAWDALTEVRPYREALSVEEAAAEMRAHAGRQWSRAVVEWTLECVDAPHEFAHDDR